MKFSEAVALIEDENNKPSGSMFKNNHKAAFSKLSMFYPDIQPELRDVYENYTELFNYMGETLSASTLRNYTHCYKLLLTVAPINEALGVESVEQYMQELDAKIKEVEKLVNQARQHKKEQRKLEITIDDIIHPTQAEADHDALPSFEKDVVIDQSKSPSPSKAASSSTDSDADGDGDDWMLDDDEEEDAEIDFDTLTVSQSHPEEAGNNASEFRVVNAQLKQAHKMIQELRIELTRYKSMYDVCKEDIAFLRNLLMTNNK